MGLIPSRNIEILRETIKRHFEKFEYRQNQQDALNSMKLDDIINLYPNKSLGENLKILSEKVIDKEFTKLKGSSKYDKAFRQYVLEIEGSKYQYHPSQDPPIDVSSSENDSNDSDNKILFDHHGNLDHSSLENYFDTLFMKEASLDGYQTVKYFENFKILHSMNGKMCSNILKISLKNNKEFNDQKSTPVEEVQSETRLISQRYSEKELLSIIVDIGATEHLTGGIKQYNTLKKLQKYLTLDTNQVCNFRFGKGSAKSIGASTIKTQMGEILFFIVDLDLSFL
ncbi:hypothetical protein GcM1_223044 [Golovinomyces cichoracearum]|uniref:Uncharacterized protein n=1 Tax=Golovinomyces cichoracearum TaxID=62708 RepID=A0A420IR22_9PEZI|nr:hypothetical protein GcM1_223044 [Golovinomyces cichoracearum]